MLIRFGFNKRNRKMSLLPRDYYDDDDDDDNQDIEHTKTIIQQQHQQTAIRQSHNNNNNSIPKDITSLLPPPKNKNINGTIKLPLLEELHQDEEDEESESDEYQNFNTLLSSANDNKIISTSNNNNSNTSSQSKKQSSINNDDDNDDFDFKPLIHNPRSTAPSSITTINPTSTHTVTQNSSSSSLTNSSPTIPTYQPSHYHHPSENDVVQQSSKRKKLNDYDIEQALTNNSQDISTLSDLLGAKEIDTSEFRRAGEDIDVDIKRPNRGVVGGGRKAHQLSALANKASQLLKSDQD
jgi:hypothetical protein